MLSHQLLIITASCWVCSNYQQTLVMYASHTLVC